MIDLSHPLHAGTPVYPGDPPVEILLMDSVRWPPVGDERRLNCGALRTGLHVGTHMDAPYHFFDDGRTIDQVEPERCAGPCALARLPDHAGGGVIRPEHLAPFREAVRSAGRVVLHTGWWRRWGKPGYFSDHPVLTKEAAQLLVDAGAGLVGVDFPSVDRPPFEAHLALLGAGVLIVENLTNLDRVPAPVFHLVALPLKLSGRDGSPVRAVAW